MAIKAPVNTDFLADDNSTYDMGKIDSLIEDPTIPAEMTPEDFILQGEGEQVAGIGSSIAKGLLRATRKKYRPRKSVKQIRKEAFARDKAKASVEGLTDEELKAVKELGGTDTPTGPFTGMEPEVELGRTEVRNINLDNIHTPEDVKFVINDMAEYRGGNMEARRGTISHEQTVQMAEDVDVIKQITGWEPGTAWNAEQVTAARQLLVNTAGQVSQEAKRLMNDPTMVSELDWANFAKLQKTYDGISKTIQGATAEAGRSLSAHNIPIAGNDRNNAVRSLLEEFGGKDLLKKKAQMLAEVGDMTDEELAAMVHSTLGAPNQGVLAEVWVNAQLSSPVTHLVNIVSNSMVQLNETYLVKPVAATIGKIRRADPGNAVSFEEIEAETYGVMSSFGEAVQLFANRLADVDKENLFLTPSKAEMEHWNAFSSQKLLPSTSQGTSLARAVDFLGDWYVRLPGRFLESEDLFFKTITYRKDLNAMAVRTARGERLEGEDYIRRVNELINNPTAEMNDIASSRADYETFTADPAQYESMFGDMSQAVTHLTARHSSLKFIVPFVRTPTNIVRYAVENSLAAPLSKKWVTDFKAGGVQRDMALARWSLGTMAYVSMLQLYENGNITGSGPSSKADKQMMRQQGWQPNSVKMGDTYYSYNRAEPMGLMLKVMATSLDRTKFARTEEESTAMMLETIITLGQSFEDSTFMSSFAELFNVVGAHGNTNSKALVKYGNNKVATFVPAWLSMVSAATDTDAEGREILRDQNKFSDTGEGAWANLNKQIEKRTPWGRSELPAQRNWKGEVITKSGGGFSDQFFYLSRSEAVSDPASRALLENYVSPSIPDQVQNFIVPEAAMKELGAVGQVEFPIDILDLDENGGAVYEKFQEYVGRRRAELINKTINHPSWVENTQLQENKGANSVASGILESLLATGLEIGKMEFFRDYNDLAKENGWRPFNHEDIMRMIEMKSKRGKKAPQPDLPQQTEQPNIGF